MKSPVIADLEVGQNTTGVFLVAHKDVRQKKGGDFFLSLTLTDRSGEIDAKMWDNVDKVMDTFERDGFVRVKGVPQVHLNKLQFTIHTLQVVPESEVDLGDFFPASKRDPAEMFAELRGHINGMANAHLRGLLNAIFDDAGIARRYQRAPAAKSIHHAWLGGLIEHVLSMCSLCKRVGPHYPHVNLDLLLTGAILHDIGKIDELTYDRGFGYSDEGQLLGHILIGLRVVNEKMALLPDFPPRLRMLVEHLIASHHGTLEFGSPKVPMTAEAMLLHHLDNLDSKMETVRVSVEKDKLTEGSWTVYVPSLERTLLKQERFLNAAPLAAVTPPATNGAPPAAPPKSAPAKSDFASKLLGALGPGGKKE
ncbi:MAG: HD domain-containing protein [Acidobacteria bacterium]|nr:HD domain-containing protein [Acidobacteriota bacterium]